MQVEQTAPLSIDIRPTPSRRDNLCPCCDCRILRGCLKLVVKAGIKPLSPLWTLCSIIARIGAIPVPGPTKIHGTPGPGVRIPPFTSLTAISVPIVIITWRAAYPRTTSRAILYIHHSEVASDLSCI